MARFIDADGDGQLSVGDTDVTTYAWDHRNRLVSMATRAVEGGAAAQLVTYTYDPFDRRVGKEVDPDGDGAQPAWREVYAYDGDHIALIFRDDDVTVGADATLAACTLYGPAVDMILAQENADVAIGRPDRVLWSLSDHLGSVTTVVDSDGQVVNSITYDSFGRIVAETNAAYGERPTSTCDG